MDTVSKRAERYGPLVPRIEGLSCPGDSSPEEVPPCRDCWPSDESSLKKRDEGEVCWLNDEGSQGETCTIIEDSSGTEDCLLPRATKEPINWPFGNEECLLRFPSFKSCSEAKDASGIGHFYGYGTDKPSP